MIFSIIKQIILSIILIVIVHYIYVFFKENLTQPKIKDLVNKPTKKYEQIYSSISINEQQSTKNMKNELQDYLKELSNKTKKEEPSSLLQEQNVNLFNNNYETL